MKMIVSVDLNWGIGYNGNQLIYIPEDLKRFKELTIGNTIVYGYNTLKTFPGAKALPNRQNILLTHKDIQLDNIKVIHNISDIPNNDTTFIIGGSSLYFQLFRYCDEIYVTSVIARYKADSFFPNLDNPANAYYCDKVDIPNRFDIDDDHFIFYQYLRYKNSDILNFGGGQCEIT